MSLKRKYGKILFIFSLVVLTVVTLYYVIINSAWYHWRELSKFIDNSKGYGRLEMVDRIEAHWRKLNKFMNNNSQRYERLEAEDKICYHMDALIAKGELDYAEFTIDKSYPSSEIIEILKKECSGIFLANISPYEEQITNQSPNYTLRVWAYGGKMSSVEDYLKKQGYLKKIN